MVRVGGGDVRAQGERFDRGASSSSESVGSGDGASTPFGLEGPAADAPTEQLAFSGVDDERLFSELRSRLFARGPAPRIGRYRLVHRLGAGAMGEVHLAFDDELERPIAIKLVHAHLADPRSTARLRVEARALARLAHPNVVHVYEVGEHDGRTYLAMERIEGGSLREWLGAQPRPGQDQVLAAYLAAGRGLAAAHRAGVVHRDFKPDNILRGIDGRVAVVDFGLAALEAGEAARSEPRSEEVDEESRARLPTLDRSSEVAGTPAYMPAEQFRGHADARSDQFALCVSIYEGLWGRRPFPRRTLEDVAKGRAEWVPAEPPRDELAGWLWPILRRGLQAEPERRWDEVDALLAAIEAGLAGRRRRRRVMLSGAAALAVGLLSGGSVAWWSAAAAVDDCAAVARELDGTWGADERAQLEQRFAAASAAEGMAWLADSGTSVAASLDRWSARWSAARGALCRARTGGDPVVLDRLGACLERHRGAAQALVGALLAGESPVLRAAPEAVLHLEDPQACAREARQGGPPEPPAALAGEVQQVREQLARAETELLTGRVEAAWAEAEPLAARAQALGHAPLTAEVAAVLGRVALARGRSEEGLERLEQAADAAEAAHHDRVVAGSWRHMAMIAATEAPDLAAGRQWLRRADAAAARVGLDAGTAARLDAIRGNLSLLAREFDAAVAQLRAAEAALVEQDDLLYASHAASNLGTALLERGEAGAAREAFARALAQRERVFGPRHPEVARAAYNLAQALRGTARAGAEDHEALAGELMRRAVEIWEGTDEARTLDAGRAAFVLAQLELDAGRFERAVALAGRAEAVFAEALEPARIEHAEVAALLGTGHYFLGRAEPAIASLRRAVAGYAAAHGADDDHTASFRVALGWALLAGGEVAEARAELEAGRVAIEAEAGAGSEASADARLGLAAAALVSGELERAAALLAEFAEAPAGELDRVTFALVSGLLAVRRAPADPRGAASLSRARADARVVAGGEAMLAVLLDSLAASPAERRLAE
ncbi:serine/threonine-protein kinase [Nannocystis punicea]|uniref:Serine/threonine-protein kinase n=1 Tax=Nannocystis punicea TaxID=2995304 RepID=A0ABY7GS20_9BACT|nr:serine/threonine-protein kinase [Nannocystis poenicansa]WAS89740.1 serine/threonine-protein kinase [Nannocystis poenicansa]